MNRTDLYVTVAILRAKTRATQSLPHSAEGTDYKLVAAFSEDQSGVTIHIGSRHLESTDQGAVNRQLEYLQAYLSIPHGSVIWHHAGPGRYHATTDFVPKWALCAVAKMPAALEAGAL